MHAVCFDMDGVLVDSEDYWVERERAVLLPECVPDADVSLDEITGMNYRDIYDYLADEYDVAWPKAEFVAWYDEAAATVYGEAVTLLPGVDDLIDDLRANGTSVALVSSSPIAWIETVLDRFDLAFDEVVSADEFDGAGKPAPDVYGHAAALLGVDAGDATAIEDSAHGVEAADRAGMTVVGFRHGTVEGSDLERAAVTPESPAALRQVLREECR